MREERTPESVIFGDSISKPAATSRTGSDPEEEDGRRAFDRQYGRILAAIAFDRGQQSVAWGALDPEKHTLEWGDVFLSQVAKLQADFYLTGGTEDAEAIKVVRGRAIKIAAVAFALIEQCDRENSALLYGQAEREQRRGT